MPTVVPENHLKLAYKLGARARGPLPEDDAKQAAVLALLRCRNFDEGRGNTFGTYAGTAIWREVARERNRQPRWIVTSDLMVTNDEGEATDPSHLIPDHRTRDAAEMAELRDFVAHLLRRLTPRERFVVTRFFGLDGGPPRSVAIIATEIPLSRWRTHQILVRAMSKLRGSK